MSSGRRRTESAVSGPRYGRGQPLCWRFVSQVSCNVHHKEASLSTALYGLVAPPVKKCRKTPLLLGKIPTQPDGILHVQHFSAEKCRKSSYTSAEWSLPTLFNRRSYNIMQCCRKTSFFVPWTSSQHALAHPVLQLFSAEYYTKSFYAIVQRDLNTDTVATQRQ